MKSVLFATKSLEQLSHEATSESSGLKRVLGPWHLIFLGVGAIVGAGIFVITGQVAAKNAGPAVTLSIALAGLTCAFAGLCYAEFASLIPIAGSAYTYAYSTLGEIFAWIIGWDLILEYSLGATTVAIGWSGYVVSFLKDLGVHFPEYLANAPYAYIQETGKFIKTGALVNLPAVLIIALITFVLVRGVKESAAVNSIIVFTPGFGSMSPSIPCPSLEPFCRPPQPDALRRCIMLWLHNGISLERLSAEVQIANQAIPCTSA